VEYKVLIVDDELEIGHFFQYLLAKFNCRTYLASTLGQGREHLQRNDFDLVLLDLRLHDGNGLELLRQIKEDCSLTKVIVMTGYSTVKTAVQAVKLGAFDYIEKPFEDLDGLEKLITRALGTKSQNVQESAGSKEIRKQLGFVIGNNPTMRRMISVAERIAGKNISVLIQGETGTGKEVLARYLHTMSQRRDNTFVPVNCGALAENLLESELFGHERGAFTGAYANRKGIFEIANRGTLFLDEIGDASPSVQVKLLRVLDSGEFSRVGSERLIQTDCRIITATNVGLEEAVSNKQFRKDLFYRLNVVTLELPPLRERVEDIPLLAQHVANKQMGKKKVHLSPGAIKKLQNHIWPGNIRELANVIQQAVALTPANIIEADHLRLYQEQSPAVEHAANITGDPISHLEGLLEDWFSTNHDSQSNIDLAHIRKDIRQAEDYLVKKVIHQTLKETLGNRSTAAKKLNITTRTLRYLSKEK